MRVMEKTGMRIGYFLLCMAMLSTTSFGQLPEAPPSPGPDARYKADILVIVAHPDDESDIGGYLARAIFDQHKRVAIIFGNCGETGGNTVGYEQADSLCAVRKIEARRALSSFGIWNAWFLGGRDTPDQNPLHALENWDHAAVLEQAVRYVRLTQPEVIITWLPDYADGENHGDHQASAIIATEAFDMAGDPTVFPEQVAAPDDYELIGNLNEGLLPWQPKKLYFFTNATHRNFIDGQGPVYSTTAVSPSRHVPYYELAAEELSFHLTQEDQGREGRKVVFNNVLNTFNAPVGFILGKSLVETPTTGDIFEGITPGAIPYHPVAGYRAQPHEGVSVELGGPWAFYRQLWRAHDLEHLATLYPAEAGVGEGMTLSVPLILRNDTASLQQVTLTATVPSGWKQTSGAAIYPVEAHSFYPLHADFVAPNGKRAMWQEISFKAAVNGEAVSSVTLRVSDVPSGPQATLRK